MHQQLHQPVMLARRARCARSAARLGGCLLLACLLAVACGRAPGRGHGTTAAADNRGGSADPCVTCVVASDCAAGARCVQIAGDAYCAVDCGADASRCSAAMVCTVVATNAGDQIQACVPKVDVCGGMSSSKSPLDDAGASGGGDTTSGGSDVLCSWAGPDAASCCHCPAGKTCSANGCYNGWFCEPGACKCHAPSAASGCGSANAGGAPPSTCGTMDGPSVQGCCSSCNAGKVCASNGCFGGWYCNHATCKCQPPPDPATCGGDANTGRSTVWAPSPDATISSQGPITGAGGKLTDLAFAVVGDTRPPNINDLSGYPVPIINKIWQDIQVELPVVPFVITTGDYIFTSPNGNGAAVQFDLYLTARKNYGGAVFAALGNHECTGYTASNCGPNGKNGMPKNYKTFLNKMLKPLGLTKPYYLTRFDAVDGSWSAKFVIVAPNAWDQAQAKWLKSAMSEKSTYTFVVRHEPLWSTKAPGVGPSNAIIATHPFTMLLVGHTHTFSYSAKDRQVIVGNGGAPLTSSVNYGYLIARRRPDGAIQFTAHDYQTRAVVKAFAVTANGSPVN